MWIYLFLSLGYSIFLVESSPQITSRLPTITRKTGSDIKLTCVVTGKADSKIQWYFVSGRFSIAIGLQLSKGVPNNKYYIEEISNTSDITVSTLTVHALTLEDDGLYRCIVRIPQVAYPAWPRESGWVYVKENIQSSTKVTDTVTTTAPAKSSQSRIIIQPTDTSIKTSSSSDFVSSVPDKLSGDNSSSCLIISCVLFVSSVFLSFIFIV